MNYTNFWQIYQNLERLEKNELIKALQAHGGKYQFEHLVYDSNNARFCDCPVVAAYQNYNDHPENYYVTRAEVQANGSFEDVRIFGAPVNSAVWDFEIRPESGHLHYIIEAIPCTRDVVDVSIPITIEDIFKNIK